MTIYQLMQSRRSVRRFRRDMPDRELIEKLIAAAVTAPSASNKQPWRFLVVANAEVRTRLATAVRGAVERVAAHIEPDFENSFRAYGDYFVRFEDAPVVIVPLFRPLTLLSNMVDGELSAESRHAIGVMERNSGIVSTSLAIQNLLLMAQELGLGASGMTGPLVALGAVREILGVPPSWEVAAFIPIGFADEKPAPKPRKAVERVVRWID